VTLPKRPIPKRPFRDSALFYGGAAIVLVVIVALTGGNLLLAIPVAFACFVLATGYAWWKFRQRIRLEEEKEGS
jgi:membrane protein implicated in regulation of membrane protease activity